MWSILTVEGFYNANTTRTLKENTQVSVKLQQATQKYIHNSTMGTEKRTNSSTVTQKACVQLLKLWSWRSPVMFVLIFLLLQFMDDPKLKPLEDDDYVAFGLACCFVMNDNLKLDGEFFSLVSSHHKALLMCSSPVGQYVVPINVLVMLQV